MRIHIVIRYVALALLLNSVFMFLSAVISLIYKDNALLPLLYSGLVTALFGLFPLIFVPSTDSITNKEGLLIVVLSWLIACLAGSLPYILWGVGLHLPTPGSKVYPDLLLPVQPY